MALAVLIAAPLLPSIVLGGGGGRLTDQLGRFLGHTTGDVEVEPFTAEMRHR